MEFQELAALWNSPDQELNTQIEINKKLVKEASMHKVRRHLTEVKWTAYFELIVNLAFLGYISQYLVHNVTEMKFFLPGFLLFGLTIASLFFSSYQLVLYYGIGTGSPVLQTQRKVARLRYLEALKTNLLYVVIPMFYAPFMIVMANIFVHYDLYQHRDWLMYSTLGSIGIGLIVVYFLKKFPSKRLQEAQSFLNELKEAA